MLSNVETCCHLVARLQAPGLAYRWLCSGATQWSAATLLPPPATGWVVKADEVRSHISDL